ncbi:hypothetical protein RRG08_037701 [Elysia crispata]|uniref:Uncharacterized protein n=1 Tax=Elysia crispata TaxID=231223 RepID=A0AAE1DV55_9GAST|nr:hypothetical protein RRG08_037701 [Elysia crispata]
MTSQQAAHATARFTALPQTRFILWKDMKEVQPTHFHLVSLEPRGGQPNYCELRSFMLTSQQSETDHVGQFKRFGPQA